MVQQSQQLQRAQHVTILSTTDRLSPSHFIILMGGLTEEYYTSA